MVSSFSPLRNGQAIIVTVEGDTRDLENCTLLSRGELPPDLEGGVLLVVINVLGIEILDPAEFRASDKSFFHLFQCILGSLE
jgi:hypothetical protein